jgi:lysophospholipase L1-like esterase
MTTISGKRRIAIVGLAVATALAFAPRAAAGPAVAPASSKATYYVSLGDSLAQGFQPIGGPLKSGNAPPGYNHGYADQLFTLTRERYEQLQEVKLGCGGETTTTLRFGGGFCTYEEGSQLAAAAAFLQEHGEDVAFVTIDIGGNDLLGGRGVLEIAANLPVIIDTLQDAAAPGVQIVAMNYYDPFVAPVWFGTRSVAALQAEAASIVAFNDFLEGIYGAFGVEVADVEAAFSLTDLTLQPTGLPRNVQQACNWTWICSEGDIHPNNDGYGVIAGAFAVELAP